MKKILFFAMILLSSVTMAQINAGSSSGKNAGDLFKKAMEHRNNKEYELAIQNYTEVIGLSPRYAKAYVNRGECYFTQQKYAAAASDYKTAISIEPENSELYVLLGKVHSYDWKYSLSIESFKQAIKLKYADSADVYNWLGYSYYYAGRSNDAIASFEQSIRIKPVSDPYKNLGEVFFQRYEYDKALSNLNEALRRFAKNHVAYEKRGDVYYQLEQFDLALKDYSYLVTEYPGDQRYYFKRGDTYQKLGERALAIADYNKGLSINANADAFIKRAGLYEKLKENELALRDFAEAIRLKPDQSETYALRGRFYKRINQFQLAELDYAKAMGGGKGSYTAYYGLALLNKAKGDYKAAIKDFEIIPRTFTKHDEAYLGIVAPYVRTGEFEKAKQAIDNFNAEYPYSLLDRKGWRFYKYYFAAVGVDLPKKQYENALANLDSGIQGYQEASNSDEHTEQDFMADILALKGVLLERLSRFDEAQKAYEQALTFNPVQPDVSAVLENVRRKTGGRKTLPVVVASNDNTAPVITIVQPAITRGLKVVGTGKELLVKGVATDESGVRMVSVNGTTATLDAAGNFSANIPLAAGTNNVLVLATDKSGNLAKVEFAMERSPDAVKKNDVPVIAAQNTELVNIGKYYALIIGVQDYDDPGIVDLDQPAADAALLYQTLIRGYTFDPGNITLLKNPTRNAVFESLEEFAKKVTAQDNLLIFYAGHGYWDEGRKQGYWFPSDAKKLNRSSWVTNADLKEYISSISSKHTLLITDACFAGSIFKSRSISFEVPKAITNLYELPSRKAMTSGTLKEVPDKSVFIEYLVKRLTQNAAKYLSAEQLYSSFRDAVINNSANGQVPQYGEIREAGDEGGDFIFVKR